MTVHTVSRGGGYSSQYLSREERDLHITSTYSDYARDEAESLGVSEDGIPTVLLRFCWGGFADALGMKGRAPTDLESSRLDHALHPLTGEPLLQNSHSGPDGRGNPSGGLDVQFGLSRAVTLAWLFFPELRTAILREALIDAVKTTIDYLEANVCRSRMGKGGETLIERCKFFAECHVHFTQRDGLLHLHLHAHIKPAVLCPDGETRALENSGFFTAQKIGSAIFHAKSGRAMERLGFDVVPLPLVGFTLAGISDELVRATATRRIAGEEKIREWGVSGPKAMEAAILQTREPKSKTDTLSDVLTRTEARIRACGFSLEKVREEILSHRVAPSRDTERVSPAVASLLEIDGSDFSHYPDKVDVEVACVRRGFSLGLSVAEALRAAGTLWKKLESEFSLLFEPYHLRHARVGDVRPHLEREIEALRAREGEGVTERAFDRATRNLFYLDRRSLHEACEGPSLRCLDEPDRERRRAHLEALGSAFARSGAKVVVLTPFREEAKSLREETRLDVFTVAKAAAEWSQARWFYALRTKEHFVPPRTDTVQDSIAWALAIRTKGKKDFLAYMRDIAPLDLSRGRHVVIVERAEALGTKALYGVLYEARRQGATVILSGSSDTRGLFAHLSKSLRSEESERRRALESARELTRLLAEQERARPLLREEDQRRTL